MTPVGNISRDTNYVCYAGNNLLMLCILFMSFVNSVIYLNKMLVKSITMYNIIMYIMCVCVYVRVCVCVRVRVCVYTVYYDYKCQWIFFHKIGGLSLNRLLDRIIS